MAPVVAATVVVELGPVSVTVLEMASEVPARVTADEVVAPKDVRIAVLFETVRTVSGVDIP